MNTNMTTCAECGEELWGPCESGGRCMTCKRIEQEALEDDQAEREHLDWLDNLDDDIS
jgi:hypothetical protein